MKNFIIIFAMLTIFVPTFAFASTADLSVRAQDIRFSTDTLIAGDVIRVYVTVRNTGDVDMSGYVSFYVGAQLIGSSQIVTLVAGGENEEAWIDFTVPAGSFNIRIDLKGTDPQDENSTNNTALSPLYTSIEDQDGDGVEDDSDNCVDIANSDQKDTDSDGKGDACDTDDDNDGLSDDFENDLGTDPLKADTDGDGVNDGQDDYPTDSTKSEQVIEPVEVVVVDTESVVDDSVVAIEDNAEELSVEALNQPEESLLERTSGSQLNLSSNASFIYVRSGWKTYEFEALAVDGSYASLVWDFGDGTSSAQKNVVHEFRSPGVYQVSLVVFDDDGNVVSDSQKIEISFFHLNNPLVQLILGALLILFITSIMLISRSKNGNGKKNIEVVEKVEKVVEPRKKIVRKKPVKR